MATASFTKSSFEQANEKWILHKYKKSALGSCFQIQFQTGEDNEKKKKKMMMLKWVGAAARHFKSQKSIHQGEHSKNKNYRGSLTIVMGGRKSFRKLQKLIDGYLTYFGVISCTNPKTRPTARFGIYLTQKKKLLSWRLCWFNTIFLWKSNSVKSLTYFAITAVPV